MKTKQEQIDEMAVIGCVRNPQAHTAEECAKCDFKQGQCNAYRHAEKLYDAGYRKVDEFEECRKCPAWSGTDCTRNPYTEGCLDETVNLKNEIKRLKKENACLLKACEEQFTFDTTENKKYSIFNSVRKEFADEVKAKLLAIFGKTICSDLDTEDITDIIDELLEEYGNAEDKS